MMHSDESDRPSDAEVAKVVVDALRKDEFNDPPDSWGFVIPRKTSGAFLVQVIYLPEAGP
jgi:hypothetical protein